MIYLPRELGKEIIELADQFPVVVIIGPRQVGKTSLTAALKNELDKPVLYLDLERPDDLAKLSNLENFAENNLDKLIVLDEVQRKPGLFPELRSVIDRNRWAGRFFLLGSATLDLIRDASESLAGRIAIVELTGLQWREVSNSSTVDVHWFRGGFPDAFLAQSDLQAFRWHSNFLQTYFERDLRMLGVDTNPVIMRRLFSMLGHLNGQTLNYRQLANSLGENSKNVKAYLDSLEQTFLIRRLLPFYINIKKRLVKSPKVYIRDSGVLHRLMNLKDYNSLLGHPIVGASWEGYVIEQIINLLAYGNEAFFYRTQAGAEMDLVVTTAGFPSIAFEIKNSPAPKLTKGFYTALDDLGLDMAYVVAKITGESYMLNDRAKVIGVHHLTDFIDVSY